MSVARLSEALAYERDLNSKRKEILAFIRKAEEMALKKDATADLKKERDQLAAHVERLRGAMVEVNSLPCERSDEGGLMLTKAVLYTPAASLLLHDAELLENMADKMRSESIDDPFENGYDCALDDVKEAASRFRKQAQEANNE
jgi:hypothetical protein